MNVLGLLSPSTATLFRGALALLSLRAVRSGRPALDATLLLALWVVIATFDLFVHVSPGSSTPTRSPSPTPSA